jgi:hypothetical protein
MPQLHRISLLAAGLAVLAPLPAEAQVLRGVVVEAESRAPVVDAEVELLSVRDRERLRASTDSLGVFTISAPRAGSYTVQIRHPAYVTYEADSVQVRAGETVSIEVRLGRSVIPLEPLVVTARTAARMAGFDERRRSGGFGRFLTREEIEARSATATTDLLRGMAGVAIRPVPRRITRAMITMQGSPGSCLPALWIDGVFVEQYPESTIDDLLTPGSIEAVEVYTAFSAAPAQFVRGSCGVILFWTRRGSSADGEPWRWKRMLVGVGAAVILILLIR